MPSRCRPSCGTRAPRSAETPDVATAEPHAPAALSVDRSSFVWGLDEWWWWGGSHSKGARAHSASALGGSAFRAHVHSQHLCPGDPHIGWHLRQSSYCPQESSEPIQRAVSPAYLHFPGETPAQAPEQTGGGDKLCGQGLHPEFSPNATHSSWLGPSLLGALSSTLPLKAQTEGLQDVRVRLCCLEAHGVLWRVHLIPEKKWNPFRPYMLGAQRAAEGAGLGALRKSKPGV